MPNYTRPSCLDYEDTPDDWLNSALIFTRALSIMLPQGTGIVVDLKGDMKSPDNSGMSKVLVYSLDDQIHIEGTDNDWDEGDMLTVLPPVNEN